MSSLPLVEFIEESTAMVPYHLSKAFIDPIENATLGAARIAERADLQRLLRDRIEIVAPDVLVIAEEFANWDDSRRRIDLLGVDRDGTIVVIELKRTSDGGHSELQALRYAAMVSTMTLDQAVEALAKYRGTDVHDARQTLLEHVSGDGFGHAVRTVLISQDFGKELTTSVLWLNEQGLDIQCVKLSPYKDGDRVLIHVSQVIPLPEAEEYRIKVAEKRQEEREFKNERQAKRWQFSTALLTLARENTDLHGTTEVGKSTDIRDNRHGVSWSYCLYSDYCRVEVAIDASSREQNEQIVDLLHQHKQVIESSFGDELKWDRGKLKCAVRHTVEGGVFSPEAEWPAIQQKLVNAMDRLYRAASPVLLSDRQG